MKTVVVSGASTGIGRACALRMDELGWRVLAGARKQSDLDALKAAGSDRLEPVLLDVTNQEHIDALAPLVEGGLDGLVNNAGIALGGPAESIPIGEFRRQFEVNFFGQIATTQAVMGALRKSKGRVVNMSSMAGKLTQPFMSPYCASKHALEAWSDALRQELKPQGMKVVVVEPGAIATPIWGKGKSYAADIKEKLDDEQLKLYGHVIDKMEALIEQQNRVGISPDAVADAVEDALVSRDPKTRYPVGKDAKMGLFVRRFVSDKTMDKLTAKAMKAKRGG